MTLFYTLCRPTCALDLLDPRENLHHTTRVPHHIQFILDELPGLKNQVVSDLGDQLILRLADLVQVEEGFLETDSNLSMGSVELQQRVDRRLPSMKAARRVLLMIRQLPPLLACHSGGLIFATRVCKNRFF